MWKLSLFCILSLSTSLTIAQRVVPGVNPGHYQQQQYNPGQQHPPPPQYQQQQQHQAPPNVNPQQYQPNQQVPVQNVDQYGNIIQQQPQIPQQQPPQQVYQQPNQPHHGEHHGGHAQGHHQQQVLHTGNLMQEKEHIAEHMDVPIDTSKMTEQELQFHYFKMHDADNNNKLDGCELIKSLIHWHESDGKKELHETYTDDQIENAIDSVIKMMDKDKDGYITYSEFVSSGQVTPQ